MRVVALNPESVLVGDEGVQLALAGRDSDLGPAGAKLGGFLPLVELFVVAQDKIQILRVVFFRGAGDVQGVVEPGAIGAVEGKSRILVYDAPGHRLEIETLHCAVLESTDCKQTLLVCRSARVAPSLHHGRAAVPLVFGDGVLLDYS